jgi:hypothetical protein
MVNGYESDQNEADEENNGGFCLLLLGDWEFARANGALELEFGFTSAWDGRTSCLSTP